MEPITMRRFEPWRIRKASWRASVVRRVCCAEVLSLVLVVCSVAAAAQQSVAVQGGSAEPVYSVVSPIGESTVTMISMTPRLTTLAGKTVCMAWNRAFKADIALPAIAEQLKQIYPDINIVPYTEMPDAPRPSTPDHPHKDAEDLRVALKAKGCSAFVTGDGG
jgi:phosphoenolpyruvate carboxylase